MRVAVLSLALFSLTQFTKAVADESGSARVSRELARIYAREAAELVDEADEEAISLADVALAYEPNSSDAQHVRALLHARSQSGRRDAIELLAAAVERPDFRVTSRREAHLKLAQLLLDSGEFDGSGEALAPLLESNPHDADALSLEVERLLRSGQRSAAFSVASNADALFSDDPRFFSALVRLDPSPGYEQLRRLETEPYEGNEWWFRAVRHYAAHASSADDRERSVTLYVEHGGGDPEILLYDEASDDLSRVESFIESEGTIDIGLTQRLYQSVGEESRERLRDELNGLSGTLILDRLRRGLSEQRFSFEEGRLRSWEIDENVDGRPEWVIHFASDGEPSSVRARVDNSEIEYEFRRYPEVRSALHGNSRYFFRSRRVELPLLSGDSPWFVERLDPFFPYALALPSGDAANRLHDRRFLEAEAYLVQELDDEGSVRNSTRYRDGVPVLRVSDTLGDGRVDRLEYFEEGVIRRALRDPTGSGDFDLFEEYSKGVPSWIGYDNNRDGIYDFIENYDDGRMAEWDYDGDGFVDVRFLEFVDGRTRTEFLRLLERPVSLRIDRVWREGEIIR